MRAPKCNSQPINSIGARTMMDATPNLSLGDQVSPQLHRPKCALAMFIHLTTRICFLLIINTHAINTPCDQVAKNISQPLKYRATMMMSIYTILGTQKKKSNHILVNLTPTQRIRCCVELIQSQFSNDGVHLEYNNKVTTWFIVVSINSNHIRLLKGRAVLCGAHGPWRVIHQEQLLRDVGRWMGIRVSLQC